MKQILFASLYLLTTLGIMAQESMMQSVIKEQAKEMVQTILTGKDNQNKAVNQWIKSTNKDLKDISKLNAEHSQWVTWNSQAKALNISVSQFFMDSAIYQGLGLKESEVQTLKALEKLNKSSIFTLAEEKKSQYLSLRNQLRPQESSDLSLLDIHLILLYEMQHLAKDERLQSLQLTYGIDLAKPLNQLVGKMKNYNKIRNKVDVNAIQEKFQASERTHFAETPLMQEHIATAFGENPALQNLQADDPFAMAILLLALKVNYGNDKQTIQQILGEIYAHPALVRLLMAKEEKIFTSMQKLYKTLQSNG